MGGTDDFVSDDAKVAVNWHRHEVTFDQAVMAFRDPLATETVDARENYGEERINLVGMSEGKLLHVTYAQRGEQVRSSQPEGRTDMSKTTTTARLRADGTVVKVLKDGSERPFPKRPILPWTEDQVQAAAEADPDARPMTEEQRRTARRVPRTKTMRRALGLTQEEFAERYQIPLGTLRDWEQHRTEPDQPTRAYLKVIASDPEGVRRALERASMAAE